MGHSRRFQRILRRLTIIDEGCVEDQAGLGLDPAGISALDAQSTALPRLAVLAIVGVSRVVLPDQQVMVLAWGVRAHRPDVGICRLWGRGWRAVFTKKGGCPGPAWRRWWGDE